MTNIKEKLQYNVNDNEVVFQVFGDLVEVSNEIEKENKNILFDYFNKVYYIEVYDKHNSFIQEGWRELAEWSTDDDALLLLDGIGVLICIPKKEVIVYNLIAA